MHTDGSRHGMNRVATLYSNPVLCWPMIEVSYSEARARFAELLDRATDDREVVRIRRQGNRPSAVLIDADDYASLEETAYLLSSPANARHILRALVELEAGQGRAYE